MKHIKKWFVRLISALLLTAALVACYAVYWPVGFAKPSVVIDIPVGTTARGAASQLIKAGGVSVDQQLFVLTARLSGLSKQIRAGSYELHAGVSTWEILKLLTRGDVLMVRFRVADGSTFNSLIKTLRTTANVRQTLPLDDAALQKQVLAELGIPFTSPEGWFYPDTYFFATGTKDIEVLRRAYQYMERVLQKHWQERQTINTLETPYDALILASIIEKETARYSDRQNISTVFYNRLRLGMRLQTDPTVIYGLGSLFTGNLTRAHLQTDTLYNTYTRDGLPPTPIAMPSESSIVAALSPGRSNYLYFVADGKGGSVFSSNLDAHNQAVNRYQRN